MKIVTLTVKNFMSIGDISINLDRPGLNLVLGKNLDDKRFDSNGSAKSALFEAMAWGLYGKFLRDIPIDDVVRIGEKELSVEVTVDPEDNTDVVTLSRVRKNKSTEVTVTSASGVPLFPADSVKDIQKYIDNWLGIDFRTFTNSVYFGKGLAKFFMSSSDTDRKELLDTILQMVSFDKALDTSKEALKELEASVEANKVSIAVNSSLLEEKNSLLEKEEEAFTIAEGEYYKLPIYMEEYEKLLELVESKRSQKETLKSEIYSLEEERQRAVADAHKLFITQTKEINASSPVLAAAIEEEHKNAVALLKNERDVNLQGILDRIKEVDKKLASMNAEKLELQKAKHTYKAQYSALKTKYDKFSKVDASAPCLHCLQVVDTLHKQTILDQMNSELIRINNSIVENSVQENALLEGAKYLDLQKNVLLEEKAQIEDKCNESITLAHTDKMRQLTTLSREIADKLSAVESDYHKKTLPIQSEFTEKKRDLDGKLSTTDSEILSLSLQVGMQKRYVDSIDTHYRKQKEVLNKVNSQISDISTKISDLENKNEELVKDITRVSFWVEAFGAQGIKSFVFENALPYITERANFYSTSLTGGTVVIDISPTTKYKTKAGFQEKLNVSAINKHGANVYPGNSDGERRRIDICILLALQDLIATRASKVWNTVIFDEIFDALDRTGIEHVIDLFRSFTDKSIFIISHSEDIKKYFDTAVIVEKKNGVSSMREL